MPDLIYVSERKIYGRLGMQAPSQKGLQGTLKIPPIADISGSTTWQDSQSTASHALVQRARRKIERELLPVDFTEFGLHPNQWIRFDLAMAQVAVHEDSGRPPEDVALFVGSVPSGSSGQPRDMGFLLCGSVRHLRTHAIVGGRMGSDTTWLHDLILEVEDREENGVNVIPEFLSEILPTRKSQQLMETATQGVYGWLNRRYPPLTRGRLRGHAIVLMDIDNSSWFDRLLVATPLYVEVSTESTANSNSRRFLRRRNR
ncbi:SAVMC3_10250 family protein [Streptomyces sp. NPDC020917]|uniref:SAVMC3_10250 family protein n=1 Tax=Streptomyces sp. NPDC020917 TaxID=3365102 RepID=UPI00379DE798